TRHAAWRPRDFPAREPQRLPPAPYQSDDDETGGVAMVSRLEANKSLQTPFPRVRRSPQLKRVGIDPSARIQTRDRSHLCRTRMRWRSPGTALKFQKPCVHRSPAFAPGNLLSRLAHAANSVVAQRAVIAFAIGHTAARGSNHR